MDFKTDEHRLRTGRNRKHLTVSRLCDMDLEKKKFRRPLPECGLSRVALSVHILSTKWFLSSWKLIVNLVDLQMRILRVWEYTYLIKFFIWLVLLQFFGVVGMKLMNYWWKSCSRAWSNITSRVMRGNIMILNGHDWRLWSIVIILIRRLRLVTTYWGHQLYWTWRCWRKCWKPRRNAWWFV